MKKSNKINNEDYLILRAEAYESNNYLKRITYNDKNEFSDETVEQLLEYIKRGYVLPYKKQIDEKNDENIRLKEELEEATRKNLEFLADKQTEEKRQYKYEEKIDKRAKIFCGKIADAFPIAIAFFTLFGAMLVFVPDFQNLRDKLGLLIAALMVISAILAFMWKRNAFSIKNKIINVIKKIYRTKLLWGERL